jgi:hypothetical protein
MKKIPGKVARQQLLDLAKHLDQIANRVPMNLAGDRWHVAAKIPRTAGWYFIETNTPVEILQRQHRPQTRYTQKNGKEVNVKIYDISGSAARYADDLKECWNIEQVYSGLASNLQDRAREHTLSDLGTAALALGLYPELHSYAWTFCYVEMHRFLPEASCPKMLLRLGEQMWRGTNGWPLLSRA